MPLATAFDIDKWAGRIAAPGDFPRLVRRLILATARISEISFPADEGVWQSGWDGRVTASEESAYVPEGKSRWELGVGQEPARKATKDFRNRANTPAIERAQTTFVFVTPRSWSKKAEWQKKRLAKAEWRDVRVFDAHDLETWLEHAPAIHVWFSRLIGVHSGAETDFESYWSAYSKASRPALSRTVVLEGREESIERIRAWVRSKTGGATLALQAESREEAIAAFVVSLLDGTEEATSVRGLVVSSRDAWNQLAISPSPLLLVPDYPAGDEIATATANGHRILVPLGYSDSSSSATLELPRLPVRAVAHWLEENGFPSSVAWENAKIARRSLTAFRRLLAERPEIRSPAWARPEEGPHLTAFLLAGSWEDSNHLDRNFLEQLAGLPYQSLEKLAQRHSNSTDSLLRRLDSTWLLVSRADAWDLLGRFVSESEFERFERLATEILHAEDPIPFHPFDEASVEPAKSVSRRLVQSLAETLALLGSNPELLSKASTKVNHLVGRVVRKVFEGADSDARRWSYLSSHGILTNLALADPEAFLGIVERSIAGSEPVLEGIFEESEGYFLSSRSPHVDLLWALAAVAWSPSLLSRVVDILAKLTRLDPGDNIHPQPGSVLQAIFQPWQPATSARWESRKAILDRLLARDPEVAIALLEGLLNAHTWQVPSPPHPRWRDWAPNGAETSTDIEVSKQADHFVSLLLSHGSSYPDTWPGVIRCVAFGPLIPDGADELLLSELDTAAGSSLSDELRREIVLVLRLWRSTILNEPGTRDLLIGRVEGLISRLEPDDPVLRHVWLFSWHPELPEYRSHGLEVYDARVHSLRIEALPEILTNQGLAGILELARAAENPDSVGFCLAEIELTPECEASVLEHCGTDEQKVATMLHGFCRHLVMLRGEEWAASQARLLAKHGSRGVAAFLQAAKADSVTWRLVEELGQEVREEYWRRFRYCFVEITRDAEQAIRELLAVNRPDHALQVAQFALPDLSPELGLEVLEAATRSSNRQSLDAYSLKKMLQFLQPVESIESSRLYPLEWYLLPLCERDPHEQLRPVRILRDMTRNPATFVQVACWAYRPKISEPAAEQVPAEVRHQSFRLLRLMRDLPGASPEGSVDADFLGTWLIETKRLLTEQGRGHIASLLLGQVLGQCSPPDSDGAWPHRVVRDHLEGNPDQDFEVGFIRGAHHRFGAGAGPVIKTLRLNREIAIQFQTWGQKISTDWPRTSAVLRQISASFDSEGDFYKRMENQFDEADW